MKKKNTKKTTTKKQKKSLVSSIKHRGAFIKIYSTWCTYK